MELMIGRSPELEGIPVGSGKRGAWRVSLEGPVAYVTLYRYLLIFKRLILESRVRAGKPSLAAAPAGPEIRPWLSASADSIISFSCLTRARSSVRARTEFAGLPFSQVS